MSGPDHLRHGLAVAAATLLAAGLGACGEQERTAAATATLPAATASTPAVPSTTAAPAPGSRTTSRPPIPADARTEVPVKVPGGARPPSDARLWKLARATAANMGEQHPRDLRVWRATLEEVGEAIQPDTLPPKSVRKTAQMRKTLDAKMAVVVMDGRFEYRRQGRDSVRGTRLALLFDGTTSLDRGLVLSKTPFPDLDRLGPARTPPPAQ